MTGKNKLAQTYQGWYSKIMKPTLDVRFFETDSGSEPVREWLKDLPAMERKVIGEDIKTVQLGWPLGMPLVRNLGDGIWVTASGKFASSWKTGLSACCLRWINRRWFCFMGLSRSSRQPRSPIWIWQKTA